mgnify:FL=1|tara:strand:+ start:1673 stop:1930 length:258 start_codon:yes stop_codon:yes gene_type:complete
MNSNTTPYTEEAETRTFTQDVLEEELVWHRDREDRIIDPLSTTDWKFQFDNELPVNITRLLFIPKNTYHRLIKGTGDLTIRVQKL